MSKAPSNPSPYSADLQAFIVTKYDPLLGVVKTLNDRLHATNRDKFRLERRIESVEREIKELKEYLNKSLGRDILAINNIDEELRKSEVRDLLKSDAQLSAPWLFSCQLGTPLANLQLVLDFLPDQTAELDIRDWSRESDMWLDFLENIPDDIPIEKPRSMSLNDLRLSSRKALSEIVVSETLIVLRNVPGKHGAADGAGALVLVAILVAGIGEAWRRLEENSPGGLGRVAVVLDGDNIGTKLRAGTQSFAIEPLV